jgi:hypothetical protein
MRFGGNIQTFKIKKPLDFLLEIPSQPTLPPNISDVEIMRATSILEPGYPADLGSM